MSGAEEWEAGKHTIQFCCGTSCDAQANLAYVKDLESELKASQRTVRLLHRKVDERDADIAELEEVINGLTSTDTEGVVR